MNNPALRGGELDPHLSHSAYSDPIVPFRVFRLFVSEIWVSLNFLFGAFFFIRFQPCINRFFESTFIILQRVDTMGG